MAAASQQYSCSTVDSCHRSKDLAPSLGVMEQEADPPTRISDLPSRGNQWYHQQAVLLVATSPIPSRLFQVADGE